MSSLRKSFALLVVFAMVLGLMAPAFAASAPSDVMGTEYETAATRLANFNIMVGDETGSFAAEREITRAEMAKIVVAMKNMTSAADLAKGATPFEDVSADHWASGFINVAFQAGLIKGRSATSFDPDAKVTYQEAITMIVRATGFINLPGSWPANYLNKAATLNITKGVNVLGTSNGIRGIIAKLANNALDSKVMRVKTYDANGLPIEYEEVDDRTILEEYFDLNERTGIITYTSDEDPDLDEGRVAGTLTVDADDTSANDKDTAFEYKAGGVDMSNYLGREVTFYVDKDTTPYTIVGIKEVKTASDKIEAVEEFLDSDEDTVIRYIDEDGDVEEITVSEEEDITVVYNGRRADFSEVLDLFYDKDDNANLVADPDNSVLNDIKPDIATGTIVNMGGGKYYLVIEQWTEPTVVTDINSSKQTIRITDNDEVYDGTQTLNLNTEKNDKLSVKITKDGSPASFEDIEEDDVVVVKRSIGNDTEVALELSLTADSVSGKVQTISKAGSEIDKVKVDGTTYRRNSDSTNLGSVSPGDYVKLFLDADGAIEKLETTDEEGTDSSNYAVVLAVDEQTFDSVLGDNTMDDPARVKLLLADGTEKIYTAIEDLRVYDNGVRSEALINDESDPNALDDEGATVSNDASLYHKFIKYETNSAGNLSKVTIPDNVETAEVPLSYEEDDFDFGDYVMSEDTKIFNIYTDGGTQTDVYSFGDLGDNDIPGSATVTVIKVADDDQELSYILVDGFELEASTSDNHVAIITDIQEDEDTYTVTLNNGSEVFEISTDEDDKEIIDSAGVGERSLIVYRANGSGIFTDVFAAENGEGNSTNIFAGISASERIVTDVDAAKGYITVGEGAYASKKYVGKDAIVFDLSDWADSSIKASQKEVRTMDLSDIDEDDMRVDVYKITDINDETIYVIIVRESGLDD